MEVPRDLTKYGNSINLDSILNTPVSSAFDTYMVLNKGREEGRQEGRK